MINLIVGVIVSLCIAAFWTTAFKLTYKHYCLCFFSALLGWYLLDIVRLIAGS